MSNEEILNYKDDEFVLIEDDIERIQEVGGMYIGYMGHKGAMHLAKEIINNMTDEAINDESPAKVIKILLDVPNNTLFASDDGRGIPHDKLIVTCTRIQSSSKIRRGGTGGASAGQNGVGLTACAALAEYFESISTRGGVEASYKIQEGKPRPADITTKKASPKLHGQTFVLKPSHNFLDKEEDPALYPRDTLEEWVFNLVHLLPPDIKVEFTVVESDGKNVTKKWKNKDGMKDLLAHYFPKTTEIIHFHDIMYFKERVKGEELERFTGIEVAIAYEPGKFDDDFTSFCNTVHTTDRGTHEDAVRSGIVNVLQDVTTKSLSEAMAKKLTISSRDVLNGLRVFINVQTKTDPDFTGQVKEKVGSPLLFKQIRPMVTRNLRKILNDNEKLAKKLTDLVKLNAKARHASEAERDSIVKKSKTDFLDQHDIQRYIPSDVDDLKFYSELTIVEGDSAGENMRSPRYRMPYQAVVYLKGMSLNSYKAKLDKILSNAELRTIIHVIGAGVGSSFDVNKMRFNKIVINTDADSDGKYISSSLAAFFLTWMRPAVEAGKIYINLSPLYRLVDKEHRYVRDKGEYFDIFVKKVNKNLKVGSKTHGILSKDQVRELLINNRDYLDELDRLVRYFGIHRDILEFLVLHTGDKDFEKKLVRRFPELHLKGKLVLGVYEGYYQVVKLGKQFFKRCSNLNSIAFQKENLDIYYHLFDKDGKALHDRGYMTLGEMLLICDTYKPRIEERFKGLGELNKDELRDQTLDPLNRKLVKLTVRDMEKAVETVDVFFGDDPSKRKEALSTFKIRRDELDN